MLQKFLPPSSSRIDSGKKTFSKDSYKHSTVFFVLVTTVEIVEKSGAGNFLQMVASDNGDLQDSVLVFALAFTGNLGSKELVFNHYQTDITSLCKTVWACERMKEPSIAAAAFTSLSQFTSHPTGLAWILSEGE